MSDLGSKTALQSDCDTKVTTNGANENTGLRVRTFLTNFIDTVYAAFQGYGSNVTAASTVDFGAQPAAFPLVGTTTVTSFGTAAAGVKRTVMCGSATPITYNATSLIIPGSASITTAPEDKFTALSLGGGNWIITDYQRRDGSLLVSEVDNNLTASTTRAPSKSAVNAGLDAKGTVWAANIKNDGSVDLLEYNALGGTITPANTGTGTYSITASGSQFTGIPIVHVSLRAGASGSVSAAVTSDSAASVSTFDAAGLPSDKDFTITITVYPAA